MALPLAYSLRNLSARRGRVLVTSGVTALAVLAVALVLGLIAGIKAALMHAGDEHNLVVLRSGADNESASWLAREAVQIVRALPGVARGGDGQPLASAELVMQPFAKTRRGSQENVLMRGVEPVALQVHGNVRLSEGRMFRSGTEEAIVGRSAANRYAQAALGSTLEVGGRAWRVVGVFDADASSLESEIWVDARLLADSARRVLPYSAVYLRLAPDADRTAVIRSIEHDRRLGLSARPEQSYYEKRAEAANALYAVLLVIALLAGTSAVFGAANTQHASVHARVAEIGTLRALGFSRATVAGSMMLESLLTGLVGFLLGAAGAYLIAFAIMRGSGGVGIPTGTFTTLIVHIVLGPRQLVTPLALSCLVGVAGGLLPAIRAAGLKPIDALRRN